MATIEDPSSGNFMSTMLISKMHKKENYKLTRNLSYTLKHPSMAKVPQNVVSYFIIALNILAGVVAVLVLQLLHLNSIDVLLLAFVAGYIGLNYILKKYYNKPQASVSELNTFVVASKPIHGSSLSSFRETQARVDFETKLKDLHDSYKKEIFNIIKSEVRNDYELKYSLKILRSAGESIQDYDKASERELYNWVSHSLEKIYKLLILNY